jgi:phage gpG-like protein
MEPISLALSLNPDVDIPPEVLPMLMDRLADLQPELAAAADVMRDAERESFATQGGYFDDTWAELAESTEWYKHRHDYPPQPLVRDGRLQDAVGESIVFGDDEVSVGIDPEEVPYAIFHQDGTSRMPARVLVSVTQEEIGDVRDAVQQTLDSIPGLPKGAIIVSII